MIRLNNTMVAALLVALLGAAETQAQSFRGIPWVQTDTRGLTNEWASPVFQRDIPWFIDVQDDFTRSEDPVPLGSSRADRWTVGFVPPEDTAEVGRLSPELADAAGRWMGHEDLTVSNGSVSLAPGVDSAVACVPWRVMPGLGDDYLLDVNAQVAEGESVTIGYFGDVSAEGIEDGLSGDLGQLVLGISRGTGAQSERLTWTIAWDMGENRQTFSSTVQDVPVEDELRLQLGWFDEVEGTNDLFDAWLGTSGGQQQLLAGDMATAIDVYAFGFELDGPNSVINGIVAAVPEPNSGLLMLTGIGALLARRRRNRTRHNA